MHSVDEIGTTARAAEYLKAEMERLDTALLAVPDVDHVARSRLGQAAADVLAFLRVFEDEVAKTVPLLQAETERVAQIVSMFAAGRADEFKPHEELTAAILRLQVAFKAVLLFVRVHQDALYTVLAKLLTRGDLGRSMQDAFKTKAREARHPVWAFIDERLPSYTDWFPSWRDKRNRLKSADSFSLAGPEHDPGVRFNDFTRHGGVVVDLRRDVIAVSDVARAIELSAQLTALVADEAERLSRAPSGASI